MNSARREKILNLIGLGLLLLCFALSLGRIFGRLIRPEHLGGKASIRFAHWQLESGLREAFDQMAADYMRLHPDVVVEQMPVPEQVYPNWQRTQLIAGTAPELIENGEGQNNEILANYFEPVTPYLEKPNPYNAGNDLARTPWRDTFIDGLSNSYNQELLEYYGIPNSLFTIRMYYNRPLWRAIFGEEQPPRTYEEMVDLCRRAAAYRTPSGERVLPVAGARNNAPYLIERLFANQTQRLFFSLARPGELTPTGEELALDYLSGKFTYDHPALLDGLALARGVGQFLPGGFMQLRREDALFLFSQGRALMTAAGSWDAPSIRSQASFDVGVFAVPVPTPDDPRYGRNTVGPVSEAGAQTRLDFGVTKQTSPEKLARIIDFLQFMTSRESNHRFSDRSGWLPAIVGAAPAPAIRPFLPRMDGYPAGFNIGLQPGEGGGGFGGETGLLLDANMYRLFEPDGGPQAFVQAFAGPARPALVSDFKEIHRYQLETIVRQDTTLAAYRALGQAQPGAGKNWSARVSELDELQTQEEIAAAARRVNLQRIGVGLEP